MILVTQKLFLVHNSNPPKYVTITESQIKDFWDAYYGPPRLGNYTKIGNGNLDFSKNCWGWTFGFDCWVSLPDYIYSDNYYPASVNPTSVSTEQCVCKLDGHVQELTQLSIYAPLGMDKTPRAYCATVVTEKNRDSGIYRATYGGCTHNMM